MRLYHYTSEVHLVGIERDGFIRPTESNVSLYTPHAGPDVVWLTQQTFRSIPGMLESAVDKAAIRIVVDVADAERADKFFERHNADADWISYLERAGGSLARTWWVVEREIPRSEWVRIERRRKPGKYN